MPAPFMRVPQGCLWKFSTGPQNSKACSGLEAPLEAEPPRRIYAPWDSGERPSPAGPLDLPMPGTAHLRSRLPRPPPRMGWPPSGPSAPSGPGERTRGHVSPSFHPAAHRNPKAGPAEWPQREGRGIRGQRHVLPIGPLPPGLQEAKAGVASSSH